MAAKPVTILWLGDEVFVFNHDSTTPVSLPEKGDYAAAIASFVAGLEPSPALAQLIYQPSGLDPLTVSAPRGNRSVVAKALAIEHKGITNPNTSWAMLTPLPVEGAYTSHLFIEPRNKIQRLASLLEERGIQLRGAWPLPALLDTLPELANPESLGLVSVNTSAAAAVYARHRDATRFFEVLHSVSAERSFVPTINHGLSPFTRDEPVPVLQFHLGDAWDPGETAEEVGNVQKAPIGDLLALADKLSSGAPSNFLPPVTSLPWNRITQLAAALMVIGAGALAALYWFDSLKLEEDARKRATVADDLRTEIAHLNENRTAITQNRAFAAEVINDSAQVAALLDALVTNIPVEITIHSLATTEAGFTLSGTIHDGLSGDDSPFKRFLAALTRADQPWKLETRPPSEASTPMFNINGRFVAPQSLSAGK